MHDGSYLTPFLFTEAISLFFYLVLKRITGCNNIYTMDQLLVLPQPNKSGHLSLVSIA